MTTEPRLSRPLATAARLLHTDEAEVESLFRNARVLVRLDDVLADSADAQSTLSAQQSLGAAPGHQIVRARQDAIVANLSARPGEGLLLAAGKRVPFEAAASEAEARLIQVAERRRVA